ncbi:MAG TPA: hypothetical protein VGR15_02275 [Bacteroidota bacterium]|jgi:hypothetical protein|nr:hypothetical protein [Bacteroidota bacterium]
MKSNNLIITIGLSAVLLTTCQDSTGPQPPKPGKRDYVWSIDSISYPGSLQTTLYTIWGSSSKDVYAGGSNERGWGELYHYDGNSWQVVIHGYRAIDIHQIYGFGADDVYLAGGYIYTNPAPPPNFLDSSVILHYDGSRWKEVPLERGRGLQGIWGPSPQNMFSAGIFGTLYKDNGKRWTRLPADTNIFFSTIGGIPDEIYLLGYTPNGYTPDHTGREYLLQWKDTNFIVVDSMLLLPGIVAKFGSSRVIGVQGKIYSAGWGGIFIKSGTSWTKELDTSPQSIYNIYGTRKEHIFASGTNKTLYHYNGTNWKILEIPGDSLLPLFGIWCNEDEVFVLGENNSKSYVIHGK